MAMALQHECPTCRRFTEPRAAFLFYLRGKARDFGDMVAVDTFTFSDACGATKIFLNMTEFAIRFGIVAEVGPRHPVNIWSTLLALWSSCSGFPRRSLMTEGEKKTKS